MSEVNRFEKIHTEIYSNSEEGSRIIAHEIATLIKQKQQEGSKCVLGLATGSSPKKVYAELIKLHKTGGLSFKNVITFNLDEYYPIQPDDLNSYVRFMEEQLFNHVDIPRENCHIPDGTIKPELLAEYCREYDLKIEAVGGLDFQLLGIGGNGHIGFNEPGSLINSRTRLIALDHSTRAAAAKEFAGVSKVPRKAITMGIHTILNAKRIALMAWGESKSRIVKNAVEGPVSDILPASYLQSHHNATFIIDEPCASELTRMKTPWLVDSVLWDKKMMKKAVVNLSLATNKSILKLTNSDYNDHGMSDLIAQEGNVYDINIAVFNELQHTITGWPGGKPNADDKTRPERANPSKKRVLIFSPHPDDDIISMGGTFQRLVDQGHEVHVGYQTSGNIGVSDDEAIRYSEFVCDFNEKFSINSNGADKIYKDAIEFIRSKKKTEKDTDELRHIKEIIRRTEAKATCRFIGIPEAHAHFMNLPFYETGRVQKNPMGEEDIRMTMDLIEEIKPHQIYAAGDLADPHGTHKVCFDIVLGAMKRLKPKDYMKDCWFWLYRGAWAEWDLDEIEMAVPMSPDQVLKKRFGIWKHQSQKDGVVFQGADAREFWQRAEERNKGTAELFNKMGLAEYAAIEAFVKYNF